MNLPDRINWKDQPFYIDLGFQVKINQLNPQTQKPVEPPKEEADEIIHLQIKKPKNEEEQKILHFVTEKLKELKLLLE